MTEWVAFYVNYKTEGRSQTESNTKGGDGIKALFLEESWCGGIRQEASTGQCIPIALNHKDSNAYNGMEAVRGIYS